MSVFEEQDRVMIERKKFKPKNSYVVNIVDDDDRLIEKIQGGSEELIEVFTENDNLVWEAADLIFHMFLLLVKKRDRSRRNIIILR
jgi:phosphoribosyl-ATP pyrophosphohydrolase